VKAIISDIHGNWEALQAVLGDIARHGVREVYCLGDVVGYGPNPRECVDLLLQLQLPVVLMGNHEAGAFGEPMGFNPAAERSLRWTREQLRAPLETPQAAQAREKFLTQLPHKHQEGDFLFVHGSPRDPLREYLFPEDARRLEIVFWLVPRYCFVGHTHVPGVFSESLRFNSPQDLGGIYRLGASKVICNVGSVGQPRDGDPRACYVLFDGESISFRRVAYDVNLTRQKIRAIPELDERLWA
jgi:diadenosine tetraphosphatase ApaH/serine/threonine PP2A family protein phosphatase